PITITSNAASTSGHFAAPSGSLTIEGMITAPPSVTVTSRLGSVTFSGGGAGYSNLQIQGGSAFIGADNGIATSAIVDIASIDTATLDLNGFDQTLAGLARTLNSTTRTATITNAGPVNKTLTLHVATSAAYGGTIETANTTGNALITGNLSLVKTGPGIQSISGGGDNTYTGSTTINGGILRLQKEAGTIAIPAGNFVAIGNGGTLQLGQSSLIHDGITAFTIDGGTFDLASFVEGIIPALTITNATVSGSSAGFLLARGGFIGTGTNLISKGISVRGFDPNSGRFAIASGVTTVSGSIQTDGANAAQGIIKTGEGTLILSGANSYTGPTLLSGGTTIVSGSLAAASAVTVGNAVNPAMVAILAGSGSVGGVGIVGSGNPLTTGASLSPGNSGGVAGILSTASLSLTAGAHLDLQIGGITAGGEAGYDQVIASGAVNLTGADLKLTLQGTASFHAGDLLYLIANNSASAVTGAFATVNGNPFDPSNILLEGRHFQLTYTANFTGANSDNMANDVALIAVPEPRAWLTMLAGLGLLIGRRRRDK
ncbi:MAG: autotransporter-associated beta strand repeat-containing protein, partial [Verrucomicrobiota bacterium]